MKMEITIGALMLVVTSLVITHGGVLLAALVIVCFFLHELAHAGTAHLLGVPVRAIGVCAKGTYIRRAHGTLGQDAVIAAAGPLASLLLMVCCWHFSSTLTLVNAVVGFSNLVPIKGTDGWRILLALRVP